MSGHKIGWFLKILFSYLLLTGILIACVGLPVIQNIRSLVREEILDSADRALEAVGERFDGWRRSMDEYARQLKKEADMSPYRLASNGYASLKALDELNRTVIYSDLCDAIALVYGRKYFSGEPIVYSSVGNVEATAFFTRFYRYEQWDCADIYADMSALAESRLRGPEWLTIQRIQRSRYLTYLAPMGAGRMSGRGMMMFLISYERFGEMMTGVSLPRGATLLVEDEKGRMLFRSDGAEPGEESLIEQMSGKETGLMGDTPCFFLEGPSRKGYRFAIALSQDVVSEAMEDRLFRVLLILGAGVLVAIGASLGLSFLLFRPVKRLRAIARQLDASPSNLSDFDQIEWAMTGLSRKNTDLLSQLHSQSASLRQHILQSMCLGCMDQKEVFLALVREAGISFDERSLRLAELSIDRSEQLEARMDGTMRALTRYSLLKILRENVRAQGMSSIGCESGREHCVLAVLSGRVEDEERVREALRIVQRIAEENFHFTLTIGVSEVFSGLEGLSEHCRSAAGAVEQRYLHGYGQIFFSFETGSQEPATEEVRRQLARLEMQALRCLRGESYAECIEAVEQYAQLIRDQNLSPAEARHYQLLLCSSIDQQIRLQHGELRNSRLSGETDFDTMDQLRDATIDRLTELDVLRDGPQEGLRSELVTRCLEYIQDHLADQGLTMETLAGALNVSSGYLSKCFKVQVGVTPYQYIDALRMQRACQLLRGTSLRISGILQACGYVDKTNFMRKFKRQYGMTPIEYRQANSDCPEPIEEEN